MTSVFNFSKMFCAGLMLTLATAQSSFAGTVVSTSATKLFSNRMDELMVPTMKPSLTDGGAGQIVVHQSSNGKKSYESLDIYQVKMLGLQPQLSEGKTFAEKIEVVLTRFEKVAPVRANLYRAWIADFLKDQISWKKGLAIPKSFNEGQGSVLLPKGDYSLEQVAYQKNQDERNFFGHERMIDVDSDLFEKLNEENKAAVILGEAVYLEARLSWKHPDSRYARYFNALIMSDTIKTVSQYNEVIDRLNKATEILLPKDRDDKGANVISKEGQFAGGVSCMHLKEVSDQITLCAMPEGVPAIYNCKSKLGDLEIRGFREKLTKNSSFVVYDVPYDDQNSKNLAELSLLITKADQRDVSFKGNGATKTPFISGDTFRLVLELKGNSTDCLDRW